MRSNASISFRLALAAVVLFVLAGGVTAAQTVPVGAAGSPAVKAPLSIEDLTLLLRMRIPADRIHKIVESHGVNFATTNDVTSSILAEGGDPALIGLLALHQRVAPAAVSGPPVEYTQNPAQRGVVLSMPAGPAADKGSCDIELQVDQTVDLSLRDRFVLYDVVGGSAPAQPKATCTGPLPQEDRVVAVQKMKGRGQVVVLQRPAPQNNFLCKVRIEDAVDGNDLYQIHIEWHRP